MKKTIKFLLLALLMSSTGTLSAQKTIKLGYVDFAELLKIIPGRDSAQAKLQKEIAELESELKTMQAEIEQQYNDFMTNSSQMSDLIKQSKQKKIQDMSMRAQEFQENAQKDIQVRQDSLFAPILNKAKAAIVDVAKENKYTYIFNSVETGGVLLYREDSDDILPLVKKKLGL